MLARGIRFRTTAVAAIAVGATLTVAGVALLWAARTALTSSVRQTAEARAHDIALLVEGNALPQHLPDRGEALLAQVVSSEGVQAASSEYAQGDPLSQVRLAPGDSVSQRIVWVDPEDRRAASAAQVIPEQDPAWLAAVGALTDEGPVTVLVVASLDPVDRAIDILIPLMAVLLPLVLAVTALVVWTLAGRALQPVEAIRARASAITAQDLTARVPVPPTHDEIQALAATINLLLDRVQTADLEQRRFVADASHELRSPIAAIRTMLDVARDYPDRVELTELVDDLMGEDLRLERLAEDLLTLARHAERGLSPRTSEIDLSELLRSEVAEAPIHRVQIELDAQHSLHVDADSTMLRRLFRNLIENALRHANESVWVDVLRAGDAAVVRVSDDGTGVPLADRERIFERFVRLDEARSRGDGGSGLGLAVCRAIAVAHLGTIKVVEPLHGGATVEVTLSAKP